ncbi:hypothetical protein TNCV_3277351 [Trichonephila clavipes]|nr:hypothetical protein TNCV_3277351 [Trichonephila clavipes]
MNMLCAYRTEGHSKPSDHMTQHSSRQYTLDATTHALVITMVSFVRLSTESLVTVRFGSRFHFSFEGEHPKSAQGLPSSLPLPPTSREGLKLNGYLEHPPAANPNASTRHLQTSMLSTGFEPSPTAPQSASLTTMPDGRSNFIFPLRGGLTVTSELEPTGATLPRIRDLQHSVIATPGIFWDCGSLEVKVSTVAGMS